MSRNSARSFADIAVGISHMLQIILERNSAAKEYFFHGFQGPFDEACYVLENLGVAYPMPEDKYPTLRHQDGKETSGVSPCYYAFQPDEAMRSSIASRPQIEKSLADRMISVFIGLACDYAPAGVTLPAGRQPFRAPCEYNLEIAALVALGYLDRSGEFVIWNDTVSPIMRGNHLWDESNDLILPKVPQPTADVQNQVQKLLTQNQRIAAIKLICDETGVNLFEALAYVKELEELEAAKSHPHA